MITGLNSEDRLVQETFAEHLRDNLGWESIYAWNKEDFGPDSLLGRADTREVVLTRPLRAALERLNPHLPAEAREQALETLTRIDFSRSTVQHNQTHHRHLIEGVPVTYKGSDGKVRNDRARVLDFRNVDNNRFLAVRELKIQGVRTPHYNRRADLVCFVNGLPLVFIELKAVYKDIRTGFDENLSDYLTESSIAHAFHHNAFIVVSNGEEARYGSLTSAWEHFAQWKRNDESDSADLAAKCLLDGMLRPESLLDLVENFILFDASRAGGLRKIVARNHQVLGVNNAVVSVLRQERLKQEYPLENRYRRKSITAPKLSKSSALVTETGVALDDLEIIERAHPDLGRLGVFWHTQGSGKSYSMAFFVQKVRRTVPGSFTFVLLTDRDDLDEQIRETFIGCDLADENAPVASSGTQLRQLLSESHKFIFTLIQKFHETVHPDNPYSRDDNVIVLSDEAHRTQAGKLARNMRVALPYAGFLGFTGTPLLKGDALTRRIFGEYVSRYDFKRSEEDNATVRLVYESRGEKLRLARTDLNQRIAEKLEDETLTPEQRDRVEKLLGKDYEVLTAGERLQKIAKDFVDHVTTRWESGKSLFVCLDKPTCARMYQYIEPLWAEKLKEIEAERDAETNPEKWDWLARKAAWIAETHIQIIVSEEQGEVKKFAEWGFDIIPHRDRMKRGFETPDGRRVSVEAAFKDPKHPFRIAIVCAMWLTGFDVECLSTLYIDKPMKAHTLMQAIARANRVFPGKDCGVIVDYNGMLKSLREALAQYAVGDDDGVPDEEVAEPIEVRVRALGEAIAATEAILRRLGFEPNSLMGVKGFPKIALLKDAADKLFGNERERRRFEIAARQVFARMRALLTEPSALLLAERHDNIQTLFRKLTERRLAADVTALLKELHKIVNEAIQAATPEASTEEPLRIDLSQIDFERLKEEFARNVKHKHLAVKDICTLIEEKLAKMLLANPLRQDYDLRYRQIISDYNSEKDRVTVEETFALLVEFIESLDEEQQRAAREGLSESELALFDLLYQDGIKKTDRETLKQASQFLLARLKELLGLMPHWTENPQTQAQVETKLLDWLYVQLPHPPFEFEETQTLARKLHDHIWSQSVAGTFSLAA